MSWHDTWHEIFDDRPADPTSREVSVQEVLASLITGEKTLWFKHLELTVEAIVLRREFRSLFTSRELALARERLEALGYTTAND